MALETGFIPAGDIQLYYTGEGEKGAPPLLLLHGNGEDGTVFDKLRPHLPAGYRLLTLDTRGHGKSGRGTRPLDYATISEDILRALDHLELERVHLLGFSDGANAALTFAMAHPGRVSSLTAVGANLSAKGIKPSCQLPITLGYRVCCFFALFSKGARANRDVLALMVKHPHIAPASLSAVSCPALVVAGEKDMVKESETQTIAASIPGARLEILPGDHFLPVKEPEALGRLVGEFLESLRAPASVELVENGLTVEDFRALRQAVDWRVPSAVQAEKALAGSLYTVVAREKEGGRIAGMGRLLGDGSMYWHVQDIIVRPECQGRGIGGAIVRHLTGYAARNTPPGVNYMIGLFAAKGKESFYRRLGFMEQPNERYGAGMTLRIKAEEPAAENPPHHQQQEKEPGQ